MTKARIHARICSELTDLYERKNHDYGDSFGKSFKEYGMTMPCIRLEDKLNRLKSLTKNNAQVTDESIDDTLMDLANYAIMTLVEREPPEEITHNAKCSNCRYCLMPDSHEPCVNCLYNGGTEECWAEDKR